MRGVESSEFDTDCFVVTIMVGHVTLQYSVSSSTA